MFRRLNGHCRWRMRRAIRFDRPARQQQSQHDTQHQLLLFRQVFHRGSVAACFPVGKPRAPVKRETLGRQKKVSPVGLIRRLEL